jgi:predicted SAM-dependent methyltransferase
MNRLNWGCGGHIAPGWINSDIKDDPGIDLVCDIRQGLPLETASIDYAVSIHALPEFSYPEIVPALRELRRVLKPGATLRLALPDLRRGIDAYLAGDDDYFKVPPGEVQSLGGRFVVQMIWYGYSRTLFTTDFALELLGKAGFVDLSECSFGVSASGVPEIVELDNREDESIFVEGRKPPPASPSAGDTPRGAP